MFILTDFKLTLIFVLILALVVAMKIMRKRSRAYRQKRREILNRLRGEPDEGDKSK